MKVVSAMKTLMHLLTERKKIFAPPYPGPEVRVFRIQLKPDTMLQTIKHRIHHIVHLHKKATINPNVINHFPLKGIVGFLIRS
jgi:hypothetical protein